MAGNTAKTRFKQPLVRRGVIGILSRGPAYLFIRRSPGIAKGGCWCFPGGHVEPGENARQAVIRELNEELGIIVAPTQRVGAVRVLDSNYLLVVWQVHHLRGEFRLAISEIAEARWLTPPEIRTIHPNLPSNDRVLDMLGV